MVDLSKIANPMAYSLPLKPKGSAEYQKDYKPENHSGCGCKPQTVTTPKKVCHCAIRYKIS